ncbi:MAG: hypothetical protein V3W20_09255 [Candidatus Neomarinimicrobiota bacterium]
MQLIDTRATKVSPSSIFLTRAEYRELYPHMMGTRINYIFKHDQPKEVNNDEAKLLLKKYPHVITWKKKIELGETERHKELDKMKYVNIKKIAGKLGYTFAETAVAKNLLINNIVDTETRILKAKEKEKESK